MTDQNRDSDTRDAAIKLEGEIRKIRSELGGFDYAGCEKHLAERLIDGGFGGSAQTPEIARLRKALRLARARIEYLGTVCPGPTHYDANARTFLPMIDVVLDVQKACAEVDAKRGPQTTPPSKD